MALQYDDLLEMYRQIVLIRRFEERSAELYAKKEIGGVYLHLYNGQEGTGVGSIYALKEQDHVITAYRDHGQAIARGVEPRRVMAEMFGKATGTSGGKGGSMHIADINRHFWGGYAIVAGHLPLAAGIALKIRYNEEDGVVLCYIGDGATNNGYFHESLNLSAVWDLPVIWMIENNLYGMGTAIGDASRQIELYRRADSYGMKTLGRVDGQDAVAVHQITTEARDYAVNNGPVLIESMTYRFEGHGVSDRIYKEEARAAEMQGFRERDPIIVMREHIAAAKQKGWEDALKGIDADVQREVDEAVEFARTSPAPTVEDLTNYIYA